MPLSTDSMNQEQLLLDKLKVFKIQGRDKRGHIILRILAKFFPGIFYTCTHWESNFWSPQIYFR